MAKRSREISLLAQIEKVGGRLRKLKKRLHVLRIREAAKRRKQLFAQIRRNEKAVVSALKKKAPQLYQQLLVKGKRRKRG
ncbi:MAG TPA: hypothetical protein VM369_05815 [Candidatus Binatia bacterium]|nr:hypothetical protein [Candidatus Binatia bacterium]